MPCSSFIGLNPTQQPMIPDSYFALTMTNGSSQVVQFPLGRWPLTGDNRRIPRTRKFLLASGSRRAFHDVFALRGE